MSEPDPRHRVRQLLLSGDNTVKNRDDPARLHRARTRYAEARQIALDHDLGAEILAFIDARLADLPEDPGSER